MRPENDTRELPQKSANLFRQMKKRRKEYLNQLSLPLFLISNYDSFRRNTRRNKKADFRGTS